MQHLKLHPIKGFRSMVSIENSPFPSVVFSFFFNFLLHESTLYSVPVYLGQQLISGGGA